MITYEDYVGVHKDSPDLTPKRKQNIADLLKACQQLELEMLACGIEFPTNPKTGSQVSGEVYGGFRPQDCPIGAHRSSHKMGLAVDRYDPLGEIDKWCMEHQNRLNFYGIYIEHPSKTPTWSHWTIKSPKSGNRVFMP